LGQGALAGGTAGTLLGESHLTAAEAEAAEATEGRVRHRKLGNTGLSVSEIGFGGHSWAYRRVPDGKGGLRVPTVDEAVEMLAAGLDMGVNFIDACTPHEEHLTPGEALRRLGKRDQFTISARCCHKMKGVVADKEEVYKFVDERLKMWKIDHFDLLMLSNTENDTKASGLWEMSHSIEALERVEKQGKVRFAGFGSHFTPKGFLYATKKYGEHFDVCSMPYNIRHRAADQVLPAVKQAGLGVVTIKPFARGSLLKGRDLDGADKDVARDMIAFVLENPLVDVCICGVHTLAHVKENFSASWTKITPEGRERLDRLASAVPFREDCWLDKGWLYA